MNLIHQSITRSRLSQASANWAENKFAARENRRGEPYLSYLPALGPAQAGARLPWLTTTIIADCQYFVKLLFTSIQDFKVHQSLSNALQFNLQVPWKFDSDQDVW
jgi:hypothetical protein